MLNLVSNSFGWPTADEASTQELDAAKSGQDKSDQREVKAQWFNVLILNHVGGAFVCWLKSFGRSICLLTIATRYFFLLRCRVEVFHSRLNDIYRFYGSGVVTVKLEGWCPLAKGYFFFAAPVKVEADTGKKMETLTPTSVATPARSLDQGSSSKVPEPPRSLTEAVPKTQKAPEGERKPMTDRKVQCWKFAVCRKSFQTYIGYKFVCWRFLF